MNFRMREREMKPVCLFVAIVACMLITSITTSAVADDLTPPPWRDFAHPYYTLSAWDFVTPANPTPPDGHGPPLPPIVGDGGPPPVVPSATMGATMAYDAGIGGWFPIGTAGGDIHLYIPNWIDFEPLKLIRVQMTYFGDPGASPDIVLVSGGDNVVGPVVGAPLGPPSILVLDPFDTHFHWFQDWAITPNPDWEFIDIFVPRDTVIDQIVVDTISLPEPTTLGLLGLAALAVIRRSRHD